MDKAHTRPPRERIAAGALTLFNQRGVARVTIAEIAAAADMREGNLHYHFARKEQLIEALYEKFEADALALASRDLEEPGAFRSYHDHQRAWFDLMSDYRCFYRDGAEMLELAPRLRQRIIDLRARTQALARRIFENAIEHGLMRIDQDSLTRLLDNAWIVSSYWMSYRLHDGLKIGGNDLDWGFAQMSALFAPYFVTPGEPADHSI